MVSVAAFFRNLEGMNKAKTCGEGNTVDGNQKSGVHSPVDLANTPFFFYRVSKTSQVVGNGSLGFLNHQQ